MIEMMILADEDLKINVIDIFKFSEGYKGKY